MQKAKCGHCKGDDLTWTTSALPSGAAVYLLVCKGCGACVAAAPAGK